MADSVGEVDFWVAGVQRADVVFAVASVFGDLLVAGFPRKSTADVLLFCSVWIDLFDDGESGAVLLDEVPEDQYQLDRDVFNNPDAVFGSAGGCGVCEPVLCRLR